MITLNGWIREAFVDISRNCGSLAKHNPLFYLNYGFVDTGEKDGAEENLKMK